MEVYVIFSGTVSLEEMQDFLTRGKDLEKLADCLYLERIHR
jgi:hypothetical protein